MNTVYGLTRASTLKQEDSPAVQAAKIRAACLALSLAEPTILDEPLATSGRKTTFAQRPKGAWLLANAVKGDTLVVSKLDRLGRKAVDILQTIETFDGRGVVIVVLNVSGSILDLTSPFGKFALTILAAAAELEGQQIAERTRDGMQWMASKGIRVSLSPGLGRKLVAIPGATTRTGEQRYRCEWDSDQLAIIEHIIHFRDQCGWDWEHIALTLRDSGAVDEVGVPWGGADPRKGALRQPADRPRTKKIRRAYRWWKEGGCDATA